MSVTQIAFLRFLFNLFYEELENDLTRYSEKLAESASKEDTANIEFYYGLIKKTRKQIKKLEETTAQEFFQDFIKALIKEDPTGA